MKVKDAIKAATDRYCELMDEEGRACCPDSPCWKKCECPDTESIRDAIMEANDK